MKLVEPEGNEAPEAATVCAVVPRDDPRLERSDKKSPGHERDGKPAGAFRGEPSTVTDRAGEPCGCAPEHEQQGHDPDQQRRRKDGDRRSGLTVVDDPVNGVERTKGLGQQECEKKPDTETTERRDRPR